MFIIFRRFSWWDQRGWRTVTVCSDASKRLELAARLLHSTCFSSPLMLLGNWTITRRTFSANHAQRVTCLPSISTTCATDMKQLLGSLTRRPLKIRWFYSFDRYDLGLYTSKRTIMLSVIIIAKIIEELHIYNTMIFLLNCLWYYEWITHQANRFNMSYVASVVVWLEP